MSQKNDSVNEVQIDDEIVWIPTTSEWSAIASQLTFRGRPVGLGEGELGRHLLDFVVGHQSEFSLGLHRLGKMKAWSVLPLFEDQGTWRRVQIERLDCKHCSAQVRTANPQEPSLYYGTPDCLAALRRAGTLRQVACPQCGGKLERSAIWAELVSEPGRRA